MYLAWIPLTHHHLRRQWSSGPAPWIRQAPYFAASVVLLAALLASDSRAALMIVIAALAVWLGIAVAGRRRLGALGGHGLCLLVAFLLVQLSAGVDWSQGATSESVGRGLSVRLDLIKSALAMYADRPFTGVGVFGFSLLYPMYRRVSEQETAGMFVHSDYLQFLTEGGPLLLLAALACLVPVVVRTLELMRTQPEAPGFERLGLGLALCAVAAHALINFVFYTLGLVVVIGAMAAVLLRPRAGAAGNRAAPAGRAAVAGVIPALAFGWLAWAYLALDTFTLGVLQGQSVPFAHSIRQDEDARLRYARLAQRLNGDRGLPVLAEALVLHRRLPRAPEERELEKVAGRYAAAREVDPWNPLVHYRMATFVLHYPGYGDPFGTGDSAEPLLLSAVALDPAYAPAVRGLMTYYEKTGQQAKLSRYLERGVFRWLPLLKRRGADRLVGDVMARVRADAAERPDPAFAEAVAAMGDRVEAIN